MNKNNSNKMFQMSNKNNSNKKINRKKTTLLHLQKKGKNLHHRMIKDPSLHNLLSHLRQILTPNNNPNNQSNKNNLTLHPLLNNRLLQHQLHQLQFSRLIILHSLKISQIKHHKLLLFQLQYPAAHLRHRFKLKLCMLRQNQRIVLYKKQVFGKKMFLHHLGVILSLFRELFFWFLSSIRLV